MFIVPAKTFDNVSGKFPIGFKIWNTNKKAFFKEIKADVFDKNENYIGTKSIYSYYDSEYYSKFVNSIKLKDGFELGWLQGVTRNDFQTQNGIEIRNKKEQYKYPRGMFIYAKNLIQSTICYSVRKVISATWLNDRDQFLYPKDGWQNDLEFQNDCLVFTLFDKSNNIESNEGINHWIPFTEQEVNAQNRFESHFMTDFIKGEIKVDNETNLFDDGTNQAIKSIKREFSEEAKAVFDAGRELWKYYHSQPNVNVNASFYDIREHFQGRNAKGRMNSRSNDKKYTELIGQLRNQLNFLADKIKPKIYEYKFLKE